MTRGVQGAKLSHMAVRLAKDEKIELNFYGTGKTVLILASWDEDEELEHPALEAEVLAKFCSLNGGDL